jgi:hypothetical protein
MFEMVVVELKLNVTIFDKTPVDNEKVTLFAVVVSF